jgi:hypothetical protein
MRELTEIPMTELTDAELKEVAGGASAQTHIVEGVATKTQFSSEQSFDKANAVNDKDHFVS